MKLRETYLIIFSLLVLRAACRVNEQEIIRILVRADEEETALMVQPSSIEDISFKYGDWGRVMTYGKDRETE